MLKTLLPVILLVIGTGAGLGAGVFLRATPDPTEPAQADPGPDAPAGDGARQDVAQRSETDERSGQREYVKMTNQFVVPIVEQGAVSSLVLLALSIEVMPGQRDAVSRREPKLRDSFLQVLFDHANVGGFRGDFTENSNLDVLRAALREVAVRDAGDMVTDVLIHDIARQDY